MTQDTTQQLSLAQYEDLLRQRVQQGDVAAYYEIVVHFERKSAAENMLEAQNRINLLVEASNKGIGAASILLADWYMTGRYVQKDIPKAILLLEQAGNVCKDPEGFYRLAQLFDRGVAGIPQNQQKAHQYLQKAVNMKHAEAVFITTLPLIDSHPKKAFQILRDNYVQQGHIRSLFTLHDDARFDKEYVVKLLKNQSSQEPYAAALYAGYLLQNNPQADIQSHINFAKQYQNPIAYYISALLLQQQQKYVDAQQEMLIAAQLGHVEAAYRAAVHFAEQLDTIVDDAKKEATVKQMVSLFAQAAQDGFAAAQFSLAQCWLQGIGVEQKQQEAIAWLDRAAQQGHVDAMFTLALQLPIDHQQHLPLLKAAAEAGHPRATLCVGVYYQNMNQPEQSLTWFQLAKEKNDPRAYYLLGQTYLNGIGVDVDPTQAIAYFKQASEVGDADGHFALYEAYRDGVGVRRNKKSQAKYLKLAQDAQHPKALEITE